MLDNWSIFSGERSVSSVPSGKAANASFVGALFYVIGEYMIGWMSDRHEDDIR